MFQKSTKEGLMIYPTSFIRHIQDMEKNENITETWRTWMDQNMCMLSSKCLHVHLQTLPNQKLPSLVSRNYHIDYYFSQQHTPAIDICHLFTFNCCSSTDLVVYDQLQCEVSQNTISQVLLTATSLQSPSENGLQGLNEQTSPLSN